jgi:hypothetical protein
VDRFDVLLIPSLQRGCGTFTEAELAWFQQRFKVSSKHQDASRVSFITLEAFPVTIRAMLI